MDEVLGWGAKRLVEYTATWCMCLREECKVNIRRSRLRIRGWLGDTTQKCLKHVHVG